MQFDWIVNPSAAASQQVQLGHPAALAACTPATAANSTPGSHQSSGKAASTGKKQLWYGELKEEFRTFVRWPEGGVVAGRTVVKGQFVQVRNCTLRVEGDKVVVRSACMSALCLQMQLL